VCNAKEYDKKWSGKEMAAQNVKHLDNCEIFIRNQFLLAITFDSWRFMSSAMERWKGLEE
jgi:hypothetical protein